MVSDWVAEELKDVDIGDKRLNNRLKQLLSVASKQPQMSINKMFHTRKEIQACYRFFSNDLVDETKIIAPHIEKTIERVQENPIILTLSDTTSLNYTTRKTLKDSGYISSNNAQGFFFHSTIAITPERLHLGIVAQKFWAREKEKPDTRIHRDYKQLEEKESYRWLQSYVQSCELAKKCNHTKVVYISDREGDLFEIYAEYESQREYKAEYVIRSSHNRTVYCDGKSSKLLKQLEESKILGEIEFEIEDRESGERRIIRQTVQAQQVTIKSRYGADIPNQEAKLNAIYLKEINQPDGKTPINWCLLTSLPINTIEEIRTVVKYYLCRWEIELFFKTLKSGCKVEEKSLRSAERLYPLFALLSIVAWRVNFLIQASRREPEVSCEKFFERSEWKAGYIAATRKRESPESPPKMKEMMEYIAKLGGHLGRKNDPRPGLKSIWLGICKLANYADAWDLFGPEARHKNDVFVKKTYA
jgi:IS4 transposase